MKPGDTVDPRTLPVGAVFESAANKGERYTIIVAGESCKHSNGCVYPLGGFDAILLSLPQPVADEVVELGTLQRNEFFQLHESEFGFPGDAEFRGLILHCGIGGHQDRYIIAELGTGRRVELNTDRKVRRVPAPTPTRQPGAELGPPIAQHLRAEPKTTRPPCDACGEESVPWSDGDEGPWNSCGCHQKANTEGVFAAVRARRAKQTSGSEPKPSLLSQFANVAPDCFSCGNACEARFAIPVDGQHYGLCKGCQNLYEAGHKDAIKKRVRDRLTPQVKPEPRWQTTDPARIAALEAKLAEQVASGGQDGKSARWLLERADDLRLEEEARQTPMTSGDIEGREREEEWGVDPFVQPGRRMSRFELPADQRLDRKRTGR